MKPASLLIVLMFACLPSSVILADAPPVNMDAAAAEVSASYGKAAPEVQEYVLHTARTFGRSGMWLNENAYADLEPEQREARIVYLVELFDEAEPEHPLLGTRRVGEDGEGRFQHG